MSARTRTIEIPSCCHIKDDAINSQQYPASVKAAKMLQGLWGIGSKHHSGWMRLGHPRVSCLEFIWDGGGLGFGREYYALNGVQNVQEKRCVDRCSKFKRKSHDNVYDESLRSNRDSDILNAVLVSFLSRSGILSLKYIFTFTGKVIKFILAFSSKK
jgi:hypothetical protein